MDASKLKNGMMVEYAHEPAEVLSFDTQSGQVELRRCSDDQHMQVQCHQLTEDPQLHSDCIDYY